MNFINSIQHPRPPSGIPTAIAGLVQYITFDTFYSTTGGTWSSGLKCCGNIATSNTVPTTIFSPIGGPTFETAKPPSYIGGVYSIRVNNNLFRNTTSYIFPTDGLSFSCWFNCSSVGTAQSAHAALWGFAQQSGTNYSSVTVKLYGGTSAAPTATPPYYFNLGIDAVATQPSGTNTGVGGINQDQWYHLVWTIAPAAYGATTNHRLYLNGSLILNTSLPYPSNGARVFTDLGTTAGGAGFNGYIDTFRYYGVELTAQNVTDIYTTYDPQVIR